jgi:hypothetical protein
VAQCTAFDIAQEPDFNWQIDRFIVSGSTAVAEWTWTATFTGDGPYGPAKDVPLSRPRRFPLRRWKKSSATASGMRVQIDFRKSLTWSGLCACIAFPMSS